MSLPGSELIGNYLTTLGNLLSVKDQKILHNYYIELKHTIVSLFLIFSISKVA